MKKVINKGYTLEVESWENDGDNYRTKSLTIEDRDEALKIAKMASKLFLSCNNGGRGIGNWDGFGAKEVILDYLEGNDVLPNQSRMSEFEKVNKVMEINDDLMGGSDYYYSRVLDTIDVLYSPKDVYLEQISIDSL